MSRRLVSYSDLTEGVMSRRLVSYSDLTEDAPPPAPPAATAHPTQEAECSYAPQGTAKHGVGNGKRKQTKPDHHHRDSKQHKRRATREVVHWDDPSYTPSSSDLGAWKDEAAQLNGADDEHEVDEYFDAANGEEDPVHAGSVEVSEEGGGERTGWKYDENAEPYDRSHRHYSGSHTNGYDQNQSDSHDYDLPDEEGNYEEGNYYEDQYDESEQDEEEEEDLLANFAIPDVAEFDRTWATKNPPSSTSTTTALPSAPASVSPALGSTTQPTRPPVEVGGGGRPLSHPELWSDSVITSAFNAALHQYCQLHKLPWTGKEGADSALWDDAPLHNSLLATQIREDAQQILAQQKQAKSLDISKHRVAEVVGKSTSAAGEKKQAKRVEGGGERRGKPIVTTVPCAHLEGNSAWKKAVKTVQTTRNSVGLPKPKQENQVGEEVGEEEQSKLNAWWMAGYYAGLAAATATSGGDGKNESKTDKDNMDTA